MKTYHHELLHLHFEMPDPVCEYVKDKPLQRGGLAAKLPILDT